MSKKVYYYSRTGNCARVAHEYAKNGEGHLVQIMDIPEDRYWGALGYAKAAWNTLFKSSNSYKTVGDRALTPSEVILVTPVWVSQLPPTFRTFLEKERLNPEVKVTVVTVSNSGHGRETFRQAVELLQKTGVQEIHHRNLKTSESMGPSQK